MSPTPKKNFSVFDNGLGVFAEFVLSLLSAIYSPPPFYLSTCLKHYQAITKLFTMSMVKLVIMQTISLFKTTRMRIMTKKTTKYDDI